MPIDRDDPRLVFVPLDKAVIPPSGLIEHIKDHYWAIDPERGIMYWKPNKRYPHPGSPQCNASQAVSKHIYKMYPWAEIKFIPSVFHKINPRDYIS